MTATIKCSCGCDHLVNSDMKDLLNSTRKCFMCGSMVSFKSNQTDDEQPTTAAVASDAPVKRGRGRPPKAKPVVDTFTAPVKRGRGRPRKIQ